MLCRSARASAQPWPPAESMRFHQLPPICTPDRTVQKTSIATECCTLIYSNRSTYSWVPSADIHRNLLSLHTVWTLGQTPMWVTPLLICSGPVKSKADCQAQRESHLTEEGVIPAPCYGADSVNVHRVPGHVDVLHHQQQWRPHPQIPIHVLVVRLQVRVPWQCCLLLKTPAPSQHWPRVMVPGSNRYDTSGRRMVLRGEVTVDRGQDADLRLARGKHFRQESSVPCW